MVMNKVSGVKSSPVNLRATVISLIINKQINDIGAHMKLVKAGATDAQIRMTIVNNEPRVLFANINRSNSSFGAKVILTNAATIARKTNRYAKVKGKAAAFAANNVNSSIMLHFLPSAHSVGCTSVYLAEKLSCA